MTTFLQFAALGLGIGAIYALYSLGIIVVYRASGVLNLAQGAMALIGGSIFYSLYVRDGVPFLPAAVLAVIAVGFLGFLMNLIISYRLKDSSVLIKVISTVAALIVLKSSMTLIWGSAPLSVPTYLPDSPISIGGVSLGLDRLILLGIAILLTAALAFAARRSSIGIATSAVAENRRAVAALGWSPGLISAAAWMLAGALAALAGILIAPISGLGAEEISMLVVPALAVALLARFESFWITLVTSVVLGIAQSEMAQYVHIDGLASALPFIVILVVLVLRGESMPSRGFVGERLADFGTGKIRLAFVVPALAVGVYLLSSVFGEELVIASTQSIAFAIVFLSVVVLTGYTGQLSLGQMALAGVGALIAGRIVATTGIPLPVALLAGVLGTVLVGVLFAVPALKTRGATLAVVTLGMGVAILDLFFNNSSISGGAGGTLVAGQTFFGIEIDPLIHPVAYSLFALGAFFVAALVVTNVRRGTVGRALIAVRTNERAAAALGVNVTAAKVYAFGVSAGIAALGGIVLGFQQTSIVYSNSFGPFQSILVVAFAVIGGVGFVAGSLIGGVFPGGGVGSLALQEVAGGYADWIPLAGGVGLLLAILMNPNGIASGFNASFHAAVKRLRKKPAAQPSLPAVQSEKVAPARLSASGLTVRFGATTVLEDVSIDVEPATVVGLIGPNGAGKTTLIDAVSGFAPTLAGEISLNGKPINRLSVYQRARAGIARSFQSLELFEDVSVRENLMAASDRRSGVAYLTSLFGSRRRPLPPAAVASVRQFKLEGDLERLPNDLSYGSRRLVAVARAVAARPSIILLDEPAAGLSTRESEELAALVRSLADDWGIGVLVVEHDMNFIMGVCDKVVVLDFGRKIASGSPAEVAKDPAVRSAYLGDDESEPDTVIKGSAKREAEPSA